MATRSILIAGIWSLIVLNACNNAKPVQDNAYRTDTTQLDQLQFTVTTEPAWNALFTRNKGWFGGDGIFAVTRNGREAPPDSATASEILIWFSDTVIGEIEKDSLQPGWRMINNSMAILNGNKPDSNAIRFRWVTSKEGKPNSLFVPQTPATQPGDYYWLGDGFINHKKGKLYIFGYRIRNIEGKAVFGFKEVGNTLIVVPQDQQPPFNEDRQMDIPFFPGEKTDSTGSFGAGVLVNTKEAGLPHPDGFIYIYGVRGKKKEVIVARVKPEHIEVFDKWTFWNGRGWSHDPLAIRAIADRASNELSVSPLGDGRYVMVFQLDGVGKYIGIRLGTTPYGPFGPIINIYDVSGEIEKDKDIFSYNAKAHPVLSKPGELLISYNVNSFDFSNDIEDFPHLYRPRFITMKYVPDSNSYSGKSKRHLPQ